MIAAMSLARIAIVGRPNVGKSSLMNMLARAKVSIVDPTPGVTRDRVSTIVELTGPLKTETPRLAEVTDTGGYGVYVADGGRYDDAGEDLSLLTKDIERQIAAAVERADLILFVVDAQSGITALDETIASLLRQRGLGGKDRDLHVQVVANKVDADNWEPFALEASSLGFGEAWMVSAKTNFRRREFSERLYAALPDVSREDREETLPEMRIALVGRRNAGKSTFVNALAGEERVIVSEIAGTTRDSVDVRFEMDGRSLVAIDTAGLRKRTKLDGAVEFFAMQRMYASIERADVVLLCIDATQNISGIDKRLGKAISDAFMPCIIVVTKWDLVEGRKGRKGREVTPEDYLEYIQEELPGLSHAPIVLSAALDRTGLNEVVEVAFDLFAQARERVTTSRLNELVRGILTERGPSSTLGTRVKVLFVSQVATAPPTIVLVVNKPDLFTPEYERYMLNRLREATPFKEVPIRLIIRERRRADLEDLLSGAHAQKKAEEREMEDARRERAQRRQRGFGVEGIEAEYIDEALEGEMPPGDYDIDDEDDDEGDEES